MINTETLKRNTDLLTLVSGSTTLRRVASTGGGEWAGPCPFCGGADRFRVQPNGENGGRWWCRQCSDGEKWHDAIAFVQRRDGCEFQTACRTLGAVETDGAARRATPRAAAPKADARRPGAEEPSADWRARALQVVETCEAALWTPAGDQAREWLHQRGLTDDTLRAWRVGYNPRDQELDGLYVRAGIVIPWLRNGQVDHLNVRRPPQAGLPKYLAVAHGRPVLFGMDSLGDHTVAVLTEGEFDAMLLEQEAGELVGVATLGGCARGISEAVLWEILHLQRVLVAYDMDPDGEKGAAKIVGRSVRYERATLPFGKDLTDYHLGGGDLVAWVQSYLVSDADSGAQASGELHQTGYRLLDSQTLGELVLLVLDEGAPIPDRYAGLVPYTGPEAAFLDGADADHLRCVHQVKRTFPGALVVGSEVQPC